MKYMINVDLETSNAFDGAPGCSSKLHETLGRHFDLTVHSITCGCRNGRSVIGRASRYWDDNQGVGYTLEGVVERIHAIQQSEKRAFARRCATCGVGPHLPEWD